MRPSNPTSRRPGSLRTTVMNEQPEEPIATRGKHLLSPEQVARGVAASKDVDLTRAHGQGNGMRVHLVTFGIASLLALVLLLVVIALASRMM